MKKNIIFILLLLLPIFFFGCGKEENINKEENDKIKENIETKEAVEVSDSIKKSILKDKQMNITILLDLSDRIDPDNPNIVKDAISHRNKDLQIIKTIISYFKKDMENKGAIKAKGKIKVIFTPRPQDPEINSIAKNLVLDLSIIKIENLSEKNEKYMNIEDIFIRELTTIYDKTIESKNWLGSDVWRFFKNDVKDYTIIDDENYRNILIILTDGYIYHPDSLQKRDNRYAYITGKLLNTYNIRNSEDFEQAIDEKDFGLITKRNDLNNLEILVLEIDPTIGHKNDEDILKYILSKWFKEMGVKKYAIYNTDLPEYTNTRIEKFLTNDNDKIENKEKQSNLVSSHT